MRKIILFVGVFVIFVSMGIYLLFSSNDKEFQARLLKLQDQNEIMKQEIDKKQSEYLYLATEEYKDKYAKMHLGKVNPDEVIAIIQYENEKQRDDKEYVETYKYNSENLEDVKNDIEEELKNLERIVVIDEYKKNAREYHVKLDNRIWLWFNLMSDYKAQLQKLTAVFESSEDLIIHEYIDLRIPGRVIYK